MFAAAILIALPGTLVTAAVLPYSLDVATTSVYSDVAQEILVTTNVSWFRSSPMASCKFTSLGTPFNSPGLDKYNSLKSINATVIDGTHLKCMTQPVDNAGIALLTVTMDGHNFSLPAQPISMFPAVEVAISRRPFVFETTGGLIIKSADRLTGSKLQITGSLASVAADSPPLISGTVPAGGTTSLDFDLNILPAFILEELVVKVKVLQPRSGDPMFELEKRKLLHRVPAPEKGSYGGSIWQVDHEHRGLLVNGELPFIGLGWFHTGFDSPHSGYGDNTMWGSQHTLARANGASSVAEWGKRGHTLVLLGLPSKEMLDQLDDLQRSGMYAMVTLPYLNGMPSNNIDLSSPEWSGRGGYLDQVYGNMSMVGDHPAVQGWYICDDCCKGGEYAKNLSSVYRLLRKFDPYHVTTGAAECNEIWAFQEPQLSLDFPMVENYRPDIAFHAGFSQGHEDAAVDGNGGDVTLGLPPLTFEPVANMPGSQRTWSNDDQQTLLWTGLVTANMASQNWFIWGRAIQKRWQVSDAIDQVHAQILELMPSFYADVRIPQPVASLYHPTKSASQNVLTRVWRETTDSVCLHIIAVNVDVNFQKFDLRLVGLDEREAALAKSEGLLPLFDGSCSANPGPGWHPGASPTPHGIPEYQCRRVHLTEYADGAKAEWVASDFIAPSKTNIYRLGCATHHLPEDPPTRNLVQNGDMEFMQQAGMDGCEMHRMGCQPNWMTLAQNDEGEWTDDRAWISMSTAMAHSGRHAARLQLPTTSKVMVNLPLNSFKMQDLCTSAGIGRNEPCSTILNHTSYSVKLWARAAEMSFVAGSDSQMEVAVLLGAYAPTTDRSSGYSSSKFVGQTLKTVKLQNAWTLIKVELPSAARDGTPSLYLRFGGVVGSIFWDDVSVLANSTDVMQKVFI